MICKFCGKECNNKNSLAQHEIRCKENPDRINNQKGRIPWNKGLTKEIDERVLKGSQTLKEGYDTGRILPSWTGRQHTTEQKDKISESRKKYLSDHPDKVPYILNHSSKTSYPEQYFIDLFEKEDINLKYHKQVSKYQLDFYNDDKKFDLEIDGEQHYTDNRIFCSDRDRDKFMQDLGWKIYRIRWSNYQKLDIVGKENIIKEIKNFLI